MTAETLQKADTPAATAPQYRPDWLRKPSGEDMAWSYPERAAREGIGGQAKLQCLVAPDGGLTHCQVLSEAPADQGFGAAALALAPQFQMTRPPSDAKNPSEVTIPIVFTTPQGEAGPSPAAILKPLAGLFSPEKIRDEKGAVVAPSPLEIVLFGVVILMAVLAGAIIRKRQRRDGKDLSGPNSEHR
jgi:TonB family protein